MNLSRIVPAPRIRNAALTVLALACEVSRAPLPLGAQASYQVVILRAPSPMTDSAAYGIGGGQAAGTGRIAGSTYPTDTHAVYWPVGSTTGVDLHPAGFRFSTANDSDGGRQVGDGNGPPTGYARHALLWFGSADTYVDLHPGGVWTESTARAIANGPVGPRPRSPTGKRSLNELAIVMERRLVADGADVQFEFRLSRRSGQVVEQTSERFARERSTTRYEPEQPRAGLNFFNELHRFDDVAALQSDEVPASSELNVTSLRGRS